MLNLCGIFSTIIPLKIVFLRLDCWAQSFGDVRLKHNEQEIASTESWMAGKEWFLQGWLALQLFKTHNINVRLKYLESFMLSISLMCASDQVKWLVLVFMYIT